MTGTGEPVRAPGPTRDPSRGWLVDQLPRALADDPFLQRFMVIFEQVAMTVHHRIDGVEHHLDPGLAAPQFVRWVGGWLGLAVDESVPEERQRRLVGTAGPLLAWRGTRKGLEGLLEALTDAPVQVSDPGGVYSAGRAEPANRHVTVRLADTGGIDEARLLELIHGELPADATVQLLIDGSTADPPTHSSEPPRSS